MSWSDRYVVMFSLTVLVAVLAQPVGSALEAMARQSDPSGLAAGTALIAMAYAGFLALARTAGPIVLTAADAAWLLISPLSRRGVLGRSAVILLAICLPVGAAVGLALLAVLSAPGEFTLPLATALLLGVMAALGGMATAVLAQASQAWNSWLQGAITAITVAAVLAALLGGGPGRHILGAIAGVPASLGTALTACGGGALTALLLWRAWVALARIPAGTVLTASARAGHVATAATVMDLGALTWIAEDNHWRGRVLRSRRWPAPRAWSAAAALAWYDWRRLARRPGRMSALLASTALPALAAQAGGGFSPVVMTLLAGGAVTAAAGCGAGARRDAEDPGLARLFGVGARAALTARALLPALVSAAWLTLALAGSSAVGALPAGPWWLFGPLCAPALAAGALRMARRRPVDHSMPVIDTPGGAIPTGPLIWAMTGVDIAAMGCAPVLLALASSPSALAPLLAAQTLSGAAVLAVFLLWGAGYQARPS
jgi:hypothetical protein